MYSWGDGDYGKLGRGGSDGSKTPKLIDKLMGQDVVKVYCGAQFTLALTKSGQVFSWSVTAAGANSLLSCIIVSITILRIFTCGRNTFCSALM